MGEQVAAGFLWGCSSVGRAPALQAGGQEFESLHLHSRTLKTEYRRILKLEKTSEGINVKLIFSNKQCKHKEPKKHTTLCMRALVKRIRAQGGCLGTKSRRKT